MVYNNIYQMFSFGLLINLLIKLSALTQNFVGICCTKCFHGNQNYEMFSCLTRLNARKPTYHAATKYIKCFSFCEISKTHCFHSRSTWKKNMFNNSCCSVSKCNDISADNVTNITKKYEKQTVSNIIYFLCYVENHPLIVT